MPGVWQKICVCGQSCHSCRQLDTRILLPMFLIRCPITGTDELVAESSIVAVTNHPTPIAMTIACPQTSHGRKSSSSGTLCGGVGVPGDGFVVAGVVPQAAVQDADVSVRER